MPPSPKKAAIGDVRGVNDRYDRQVPAPSPGTGEILRSRWARRIRRAVVAMLFAGLAPIVIFHAAVRFSPYPAGISDPPPASTLLLDRSGAPLVALAARDGNWHTPLTESQISPHLMQAIVAVEDARFYQHGGVDWKSASGAAWENLRYAAVRRGASTITMQLQHLRDPRPRTFWNKFEQSVRADQIERRSSKRRILVEYVNRAPFGGNLVGAGAASLRYFGHPCRDLSLGEAALLAGLPQSPARFRPDRFPRRAAKRRNHVLDRMLSRGFITQRERDEAVAEPVGAAWRDLPQDRGPGVPPADGAMPALQNLADQFSGRTVRTTLDAAVQRTADRIAEETLAQLRESGVSAAAVVVLDTPHSQCLALVSTTSGGAGVGGASIDLTCAPRSTGSVLKPFIYAAAFDDGICAPTTIVDDSPAAWPGYMPSDYDRQFRGSLTAADALAESRNIPAMVLLSRVGVERAANIMDSAGLAGIGADPQRYGLSLAIGGADATPRQVATAYASLARGGICAEASLVLTPGLSTTRTSTPGSSRLDSHGAESSPPFGRALKGEAARFLPANACWEALSSLSDPDRTARICREAARTNAAWKTGTSSGHRDAWCAAVTRRFTIVVWVGNAAGQSSPALVGSEAAAPAALRLISLLDSGQSEPWPRVEIHQRRSGDVPAHLPPAAQPALTLISPLSGQQFIIDTDAPGERQRVLLHAASSPAAGERPLWWFVDGLPLAAAAQPDRIWWQPSPGSHEVRVADSDGHNAAVTVHVIVPAR